MECWQRCGCFKVRGAINAVAQLSEEEKRRGLVTCSSGNHGLALAYAASLFGRPATRVFVPQGAPRAKLERIRAYGAEVVIQGRDFHEALDAALEYTRRAQSVFVHSHDHPPVIAGQGTVGLEILEQLPDVQAIVVPVGGGGLISGIVTAVKSAREDIAVHGAQSAAAPGAWLCFRDGVCHERIELKPSLADGLSGSLSPRTFALTYGRVAAIHLAEEQEIAGAMRVFLEAEQLVVEGSAAVGLAVLLAGKLDVVGKKTVLVLTGRNVDAEPFLAAVADS